MKKLLLFIFSFISLGAMAQVIKPDLTRSPNGPNTIVDWNVKFKTMIIPHGNTFTLAGAQDSTGHLRLRVAGDTSVAIYIKGFGWLQFANKRDLTGSLLGYKLKSDTTGNAGYITNWGLKNNNHVLNGSFTVDSHNVIKLKTDSTRDTYIGGVRKESMGTGLTELFNIFYQTNFGTAFKGTNKANGTGKRIISFGHDLSGNGLQYRMDNGLHATILSPDLLIHIDSTSNHVRIDTLPIPDYSVDIHDRILTTKDSLQIATSIIYGLEHHSWNFYNGANFRGPSTINFFTNINMNGVGIIQGANRVDIQDSNGAYYSINKFPGDMEFGTALYGIGLDSATNRLHRKGTGGGATGENYLLLSDIAGVYVNNSGIFQPGALFNVSKGNITSSTQAKIDLIKTGTSARTWGLYGGTASATGFSIYNVMDSKTGMYIASDGEVRFGTATNIAANGSRMYIFGGSNGANVDSQGDASLTNGDQATFEAEAADYNTSAKSLAIRYFGSSLTSPSTILGITALDMAVLDFGVSGTNIIRSSTTNPILVGVNNTEVSRFETTGQSISGRLALTGSSAFMSFPTLASPPSTPASGFHNVYFDASGRFSWMGSNGFAATFSRSLLSGTHIYNLPNADGTLQLSATTLAGYGITDAAPITGSANYQATLGGTGYVKSTAGVISYDNSTLLNTSSHFVSIDGNNLNTSRSVSSQDLNLVTSTQDFYNVSPTNGPGGNGYLQNKALSTSILWQTYMNTSGNMFMRYTTAGNASWNAWNQVAYLNSPVFTTPTIADNGGSVNISVGTTSTTSFIGFSQSRMMVGYNSATTNAAITAGSAKGFEIWVNNNTFGSGTKSFSISSAGAVAINVGSDANGDSYYRNSSSVLARIPIAAAGNFLASTGTIPAYTAFSSLTSGDFIYWNGSNWANRTLVATSPLSWNASTATMSISGVPLIQSSSNLTAQTSAGNITTFTVGAATATFNVSAYINITAVATDVIQAQVTYTDENNTAQTVSFTTLSTVSNSTYNPVTIRAKNGTVITLKTNLTTGIGSITFDAGGSIIQN